MYNEPNWFAQHPIIMLFVATYVVVSGLMIFADVRRPLMRWYQSQGWLISGKGPIDILLKQIGYRLTVEAFAFGVACIIGSLGGNVYIIKRAQKIRRVEQL